MSKNGRNGRNIPPVEPLTKEYDDDTISYSDSEIELTEYEKRLKPLNLRQNTY